MENQPSDSRVQRSPILNPQFDVASDDYAPTDPQAFEHYLFCYLAFQSTHRGAHVNKDSQPRLHAWLSFVKREYGLFMQDPSKSVLHSQDFDVLKHLHIPLTSRGEEHWYRFYGLLVQYHQQHGHVLVPRVCEIPGLGDWVTDQRRQYKAWKLGQSTQLTPERRMKLEALNFTWQVRYRLEWDKRFQELVDYKNEHGDVRVPQHYQANKTLGKWVAKQREQYKLLMRGEHSFLTADRLERLEQIGFVWQVKGGFVEEDEEEEEGDAESAKPSAKKRKKRTTEEAHAT
jgi:hypothetical protein